MASCTVGNLTIAMQNTGSEKFPHTPFTRNFPRGYRSTSTVTKFDQRTLPPRGQPNNLLICALTTSIAKRKSGTQLKPLPLPSGFFFSTIVDASEIAETVPIATLQKASLSFSNQQGLTLQLLAEEMVESTMRFGVELSKGLRFSKPSSCPCQYAICGSPSFQLK